MSRLVVIGEPLLIGGLERQPGFEFEPSSDEAGQLLVDNGQAAKAGTKDAKVAEDAADKPLEDLSVRDLRKLAEQRQVDLGDAKKKDEIIAALEASGPAEPTDDSE